MESIKVTIENWQGQSWTETWIPIIIAIIALVVSLVSMYMTKIQFRKSSRPFICAMNYANLKNDQIIPIPSLVGYRITNSPAKIYSSNVKIQIKNQILINHMEKNFVRYNASNSEWSFGVGTKEFNELIKNHGNNEELQRIIKIKYSALEGGKVYSFSLIQKFIPQDNQWKDIKAEGT